jgi:hypothetical protein
MARKKASFVMAPVFYLSRVRGIAQGLRRRSKFWGDSQGRYQLCTLLALGTVSINAVEIAQVYSCDLR